VDAQLSRYLLGLSLHRGNSGRFQNKYNSRAPTQFRVRVDDQMNAGEVDVVADQVRKFLGGLAQSHTASMGRSKCMSQIIYLAALIEYRRRVPNAPADDRAISATVIQIVAAAINANSEWFWHGPDA
jgi:hypothetical protein